MFFHAVTDWRKNMLDRNNPKPLYAQLEDRLRSCILSGEWQANHAIPSENEMSRTYGLSRMTVRSVVTTLVNEGLLYRVQGKGTFVAEPKISTRSPAYLGVREQLEQMGYQTSTRLVTFNTIEANGHVAAMLGIQRDDPVYFLERVRYASGRPISIHRSYLPCALCPALADKALEGEQLCVILEREFGFKTAFVSETLESIMASASDAMLLQIEQGFPLLRLEDVNITAAHQPFEYTTVLFRGDKIKLHFEYDA